MSTEKLEEWAAVEASLLHDDPPEYSFPDESLAELSLKHTDPAHSGDSGNTTTRTFVHQQQLDLFSKCTRCTAKIIPAKFHHYSCPKCTEIIACICQTCQEDNSKCRIHHVDLVKRIIKSWPALPVWENYISPSSTKYDNPLIHALKSRDDDLTTFYARDTSLLNARTELGYTPLHFAAHLGLVSGASILLAHGALINARDDSNQPPLMTAILLRQSEIVDLLLGNNTNVNSVGGLRDSTALHAAASNGSHALVSLLLENGAIIDPPSGRGTPLQLASRLGSFECASVLLEKGANPNARSEIALGAPPIILAAENDSIELVDLLVKYGADIDLPSVAINAQEEYTSLYRAVSRNRRDMAKRLMKHGANVDWCTKFGISCLMRAAALGFVQMAGLLIDAGADVNLESSLGMNALSLAAIFGKEDVVTFLLEKGASGKPPKLCRGKWKNVDKYRRDKTANKEKNDRILKQLRGAKHK